MKNTAGLARLRALCHAGLTEEMFIPAALEALHAVVPSYRNLFDWCDEEGELVRYWFEGPVDARIAALYFDEFYNRREAEAMPQFRHALRSPRPILTSQEMDTAEFLRSALYNEIWRPQGLRTRLEALVRGSRGRTLGSLVLYRGATDRKFTAQDGHLLECALPYIAYGLEQGRHATGHVEYAATSAAKAVVVLDAEGRLSQASDSAMKLLMLAHGGITPEAVGRMPRREAFSALDDLWRGGGAGTATVQNAWGRFVFESEQLWPIQREQPPSLEVAITQYEPRVVSIRRALDRLPLSPAQRDVCALLHRGEPQSRIATQLHVGPATVADHVRKIYAKLDVHSVAELSARIAA